MSQVLLIPNISNNSQQGLDLLPNRINALYLDVKNLIEMVQSEYEKSD